MQELIVDVKKDLDSVGGCVECGIYGVPAGVGNPIFDGIENAISSAVFGIGGVKGIEFGAGFEVSEMKGSENNDEFYIDNGQVKTKTNNHGGILGGISSGMPITFSVAFKPTPSIFKEQQSIDMTNMTPAVLTIKGRHDPCIVLRAVPVFEAATAIAICDMIFDK
jgi:chorismate synthase